MARPMVEITRARAEHLPLVYGLETRCFEAPWAIESLYADICVWEHTYYILWENGVAVGYAGMDVVLDEAHIRKICVERSCRQKGYGTLLLEKLEQVAADKGVGTIMLEVRASNTAAQALYHSCGYQKKGVRKAYYANKEDALLLQKSPLQHSKDAT